MAKATIVSLHPMPINEHKPGMSIPYISIPAAPKDDFVVLVIEDASHGVYMDSERGTLSVPEPAPDFAEHIVNDFLAAQIGRNTETGAQPGVFWVDGALTKDEVKKQHAAKLALALKKQILWFEGLVKRADDDWATVRRHDHISEVQRRAAVALNLQREWLVVSGQMGNETCPACSTVLPNPVPVLCPNCRLVLDKARYATMEFAKG